MVQTSRVLSVCGGQRLDITDTWVEGTVLYVGNILRVLLRTLMMSAV